MSYKLTKGIKNVSAYNLGGISQIWLLNIDDFINYKFKDDGLYDNSYVDAIFKKNIFFELGSVDETSLKESIANGMYTQELNTFIRSLNHNILSQLRLAMFGRYLVAVRTMDNRHFVFGSDGGAKLSYSATSGQRNELNGIQIRLEKNSIYPIFEIEPNSLITKLLATESSSFIILENNTNINELIEIK